jgi:2',3'-cyclic-nucleotide 2'-phosphodiesterase (5'-nucleotidase family)
VLIVLKYTVEAKILYVNKKECGGMKKYIALILGFIMLSSNVYGQTTANNIEYDFDTTLDIVHTTDIHGNAEDTDSYLGYDKIAG